MPINFDRLETADTPSLIEARSALESLLASPGWTIYGAFMESQQAVILNSVVMQPLTAEADVYKQEYDKGRYAGFDVALNHPRAMIAELTAAITDRPDHDTTPLADEDTGLSGDGNTTTPWDDSDV